jgi:hypothetical protein
MTAALVGALAVVAVLAAAALVLLARVRRQQRDETEAAGARTRELEGRVETAEAAAAQAAARAHAAEAAAAQADARAHAAEAAAAQADARADTAEAAAQAQAACRRVLAAVWALDELGRSWQRRAEEELTTATSPGHSGGVAGALSLELARIREETGTPGSLHVRLAAEPAPGDSLLLTRAAQVLLGALARRCDAFDVELEGDADVLVVLVTCEGPDGRHPLDGDLRDLDAAVACAGGSATFTTAGEQAQARVAIPVTG